MEDNANDDACCRPCPSIVANVAITAAGAAVLAWMFGRSFYKRDLVRSIVRAQQSGAGVVDLPDAVW